MTFEPRNYQARVLKGLAFSKTPYTGLVAAGLGTGKTAMAVWNTLAAFSGGLKDKRVLVVGPVRTEHGWRDHWKDLAGVGMRTLGSGRSKTVKAAWEALYAGEPGVYFITWELMRSRNKEKRFDGTKKREVYKAVRKPFGGVVFDMVIADEWHRACNNSSLNFQVVSRIKSKHRVALSATPAGNKPCNIWAALKWLWPAMYGGFWDFAERYFTAEFNTYSAFGKDFTGERHPGTVRRGAPSFQEVSQQEANPELPGVVVHRIGVGLNLEQRMLYRDLEKDALAYLDGNPLALSIPMEIDLRLRQITLGVPSFNDRGTVDFAEDCKSSKLDALVDAVQDLPDDEPFVVWVHSQKFIKAVLHRLRKAGVSCIEVSGRSRGDFRDLIDGSVRAIVAQHEAMSEGVDGLQRVCATEFWLSQSNSLVINEQATGRLNRQGQERVVNRFLIQAENTIDDRVLGRLQQRYSRLKESGLI